MTFISWKTDVNEPSKMKKLVSKNQKKKILSRWGLESHQRGPGVRSRAGSGDGSATQWYGSVTQLYGSAARLRIQIRIRTKNSRTIANYNYFD
jgi:hypothetical protein